MKKAILIMSLLLLVTFAFSQDGPQKTKMFGINPIGLLFHIYSGHFGVIINDGANEINVPFFYWHPVDDITIIGLGAKYRFYKDKTGKGVFYGPLINVMNVKWTYDYLDENLNEQTEDINAFTFTPGAEVGYRWAWENGFTLAPTIGAGYTIGKVESSTGEEASYGSNGISWSLGLGLAYMW